MIARMLLAIGLTALTLLAALPAHAAPPAATPAPTAGTVQPATPLAWDRVGAPRPHFA
ncbi:MAG: hypothetical protein NZ524_01765 [Thiobacillaceae bacterium]|nr:hypothetical protein [Thiobacillaceae bacterium]